VQRAIWGLLATLVAFGVLAPATQALPPSLSVPSTTYTNITAFEAAAGGSDNGTTAGEQGGGYRHWTPAGMAVDGSDPGSTAIPGGHTAAMATNRLQPWGLEIGPAVAVANDGFLSVNSQAGFSPPSLWAPFNTNTAQFQIVRPGGPAPSVTRGLGVEFVNVENSSTTIQYYSGDTPLLPPPGLQVPTGTTAFAGVLFATPVVTSVTITLGSAQIFNFDGSTVTPVGTGTTMSAGDDVVLAEPGAGQATATTTAGVPVSLPLVSFDSGDAAGEITAAVNWGDGTSSNGIIVPGTGSTFGVTGSHSYAMPGRYTANVTVADFSGSELQTQAVIQVGQRFSQTSVVCSPSAVAVSSTTLCTAAVSDSSPGSPTAPTGVVTFSSPTAGGSFPTAGSCTLGATALPGTSMCVAQFEPSQRPPVHAVVIASYRGDSLHSTSQAAATLTVQNQRCSLSAVSHRLRANGFGLIVTCDARASVQVSAQAHVTRGGPFRPFSLAFGSGHALVNPGRPTVLVVKPAPGVVRALLAALARHQRVSLKLTLTATSHTTRTTTTKRVSAIRAY
jgi:PKD domain